MPQYGTWLPYTGRDSVILAVVLLLVTAVLAFLGIRLHRSIAVRHSGRFVAVLLSLMWVLTLMTFGNNILTYYQAITKEYGDFTPPTNPISNVTAVAGLFAFFVIILLTQGFGWKMALVSALAGAIVGPMIFELPFDLIVMGRIYPRPTPLVQLTLLYFFPLFLWELSSFLLLSLSTAAALSRYTLFALAAMFLVFAIWAASGFSYPDSALPIALNVIGKVLAFAAAVSMFLPAGQPVPASTRLQTQPLGS